MSRVLVHVPIAKVSSIAHSAFIETSIVIIRASAELGVKSDISEDR